MQIEIIAVPPGEAPLWVREKWIGVCIPLAGDPGGFDGELSGVMTGRPSSENAGGYEVLIDDALEALGETSPEAATWWRTESPAVFFANSFIFSKSVCRLIE